MLSSIYQKITGNRTSKHEKVESFQMPEDKSTEKVEAIASNDNEVMIEVGMKFLKEFPGHGIFRGMISDVYYVGDQIDNFCGENASDQYWVRCTYEDGDFEDLTLEDVRDLLRQQNDMKDKKERLLSQAGNVKRKKENNMKRKSKVSGMHSKRRIRDKNEASSLQDLFDRQLVPKSNFAVCTSAEFNDKNTAASDVNEIFNDTARLLANKISKKAEKKRSKKRHKSNVDQKGSGFVPKAFSSSYQNSKSDEGSQSSSVALEGTERNEHLLKYKKDLEYNRLAKEFYWQCHCCMTMNPFDRLDCTFCRVQKSAIGGRSSPLLIVAEKASRGVQTVNEALKRIPPEYKSAIPASIIECIMHCRGILGETYEKNDLTPVTSIRNYEINTLSREASCSTFLDDNEKKNIASDESSDYNQESALMTDSNSEVVDDSSMSQLYEDETFSFPLTDPLTPLMVTSFGNVTTAEDTYLSQNSLVSYPMGMLVRRFFTHWGFHDGMIVSINKQIVLNDRLTGEEENNSFASTKSALVYSVKYGMIYIVYLMVLFF